MLIEQRFDASTALRFEAENELVVRIGSAVNWARRQEYDAVALSWERREEGLYIRKPGHVWGWDIMPRAVSAGIFRPIRLETPPLTAIEQLYFYTLSASEAQAVLGVRYQFRTPAEQLAIPESSFRLRFSGVCETANPPATFTSEQAVEFVAGGCTLTVPNPALWWPQGYGDPHLYTITTELLHNGQAVASRTECIGIRTLAVERTELAGRPYLPEPAGTDLARIDTSPDPASHFIFRVNGQLIQVHGSNWVPLDAFHSRDAERVEAGIALAVDLGCNMLRCWGGNVYEGERFFELCDQHGLLVWQDFAFACARYPQDEVFLARVRTEAEQVVKRLRNHACLAIWCGDNEIDMAYLSSGLSPEHNRITREVLPGVLHRLDPYRAFVPSSPYTPPSVFQTTDPWRATPEQHLWGIRNYFKSPFYQSHSAHFIGEIGYHGCPNVDSIRKFISPEQVWPGPLGWQNNPEWHTHDVYHWNPLPSGVDGPQRDRIQLMADQVKELFGAVPTTLEDFVLASQISQAEAKKFFIESTRARKWATSGLLWWNVIDGWPQFSDAVVDYYYGKKLAYHYIWRAQRPLLLMIGEAGSGLFLPLIACNDTREDVHGHYSVRVIASSAQASREVLSGEFHLPPNQTWQLGRLRTFASDQQLYLIEWQVESGRLAGSYGNHYVSGRPPFGLEQYKGWLAQIQHLPRSF
jgi:beta-mannosidase